MEELVDMIVSDESPSEISDKIKDILFSKASERVDYMRPEVASTLFGGQTESEE
jgi:hypothetical protein